LPDPGALFVTLATVVANRASGDPVWLLVIGPPGGGKTEMILSIGGQPDVHPAATLTEASLLSGVPRRERLKDAKGGLLLQIGGFGILLCKDFGSVLSMNRDARAQVLAALREVYDGSWTRHVGSDGGRTLTWSGKIGLIAGCTPAIDSHHAVMGSMGERFVLYRMPPIDADTQARRALDHVGREATMRSELAAAIDGVLASTSMADLTWEIDDATKGRLVSLATLGARCRSAVERDPYSREITLVPEPEAPARLARVLLRLFASLRVIGASEAAAWTLVRKCALDSMPAVRRTMLEDLMRRDGVATTSQVSEATLYPISTTRRSLEDLAAHRVVDRHSNGEGRADDWRVASWTRARWASVPEMSVSWREDHAATAEADPLFLSLFIDGDKSGTPTVEDDYPRSALDTG
jgi:hypothetical protein